MPSDAAASRRVSSWRDTSCEAAVGCGPRPALVAAPGRSSVLRRLFILPPTRPFEETLLSGDPNHANACTRVDESGTQQRTDAQHAPRCSIPAPQAVVPGLNRHADFVEGTLALPLIEVVAGR